MQQYQEYKVQARSLPSNLLILVISVGLILWSFRLIQTKLTSVTSVDAVVNGTLIDIKAPSEGTVFTQAVNTGDITVRDRPILTLKNERISKLQVQEINSRINQQQAQLDRSQAQLNRQLALMQRLLADEHKHRTLVSLEAQQSLAQMESDLQGAQARYNLAQLSYKRTKFLATQGALPQANLDTAAIEMEQRQAEVSSLKARLNALRTDRQAAQLGLSLTKTRSNFDPEIRLEELQLQIADQRKTIQMLKQSIQDAKAELIQANADIKRKQTVVVSAPTSGVIWRLSAQRGKFVQQGESLGQALDCGRRWVDVFVDERAVRSLQPGTPATIELYGSKSPILHGSVSMVRSGLGRLAAGEDIAIAIDPNLRRNTQVRVELAPDTDKGSPNLFCYVGYTGRVTFKVK
jgi:multidrug resistance efflux pump